MTGGVDPAVRHQVHTTQHRGLANRTKSATSEGTHTTHTNFAQNLSCNWWCTKYISFWSFFLFISLPLTSLIKDKFTINFRQCKNSHRWSTLNTCVCIELPFFSISCNRSKSTDKMSFWFRKSKSRQKNYIKMKSLFPWKSKG